MTFLGLGTARPALILLGLLALSACSATGQIPQTDAKDKMTGMTCSSCSCCKQAQCSQGCCEGMEGKSTCCSGMSNGTGMMCQGKGKDMGNMDHSMMSPASPDLYASAMKSMHENMSLTPTGNADVDFMRGMIPHHQGAIDMAQIVLTKGKDPQVRKLATSVIQAQESEILFMRNWLKKHDQ